MYINHLELTNFRTFAHSDITFVHPNSPLATETRYNNINVILGNNGFGKTTLLKAIALTCLGPAISSSGLFPYRLIRQVTDVEKRLAKVEGDFYGHKQDLVSDGQILQSRVEVIKRGDLETLNSGVKNESLWEPIFSEQNDAFFFVGYGATRTVEKSTKIDFASRSQSSFLRAQRVKSLFEETYSLVPLTSWLPQLQSTNRGRYTQVFNLINRLIDDEHFTFTGQLENDEYLFDNQGVLVPFPALSDGYRAYLGWMCDLLYHVTKTCPNGKKLVDNCGMVMIDEIDLHLHPKWQMTVLPTLAKTLPNIQFIVTTHSPLVVGSIDAANVIAIQTKADGSSDLFRSELPTYGLDADQLLLTEYFGLRSTIADEKALRMKSLTEKARIGDVQAATELLKLMSQGGV